MIENKKRPSILEANILYLFIGMLLIVLGTYSQSKDLYVGLLITEYIIVLLPVVLYLKLRGYSFKTNLRLNKINFKQVIITILIVIFSYPVAVFFNFIGITILSAIGDINPNSVPLPSTLGEYIISFLVIAITPGICEEVMFRGMIMSSYNKLGKRKAILYSAIAFGVFHFNGANLLGPIYLGIIFGIIVYKTNSLYLSIIGHTVNNGIALTIGYYLTNLGDIGQDMATSVALVPGIREMIMAVIILGLGGLLCGCIVYRLIKLLPESVENKNELLYEGINKDTKLTIVEMIPMLIVLALFIVWNYKFLFI